MIVKLLLGVGLFVLVLGVASKMSTASMTSMLRKKIVYIKMYEGGYACSNASGTVYNRRAKGPESKWIIEDFTQQQVRIQNAYFKKYLSSEDNGGINASVTSDKLGPHETFTLIRNPSGSIHLKTSQGTFVGNVGLFDDVSSLATTAGAEETLIIEKV